MYIVYIKDHDKPHSPLPLPHPVHSPIHNLLSAVFFVRRRSSLEFSNRKSLSISLSHFPQIYRGGRDGVTGNINWRPPTLSLSLLFQQIV